LIPIKLAQKSRTDHNETALETALDRRRERMSFNASAAIERFQPLEAQSADANGSVVGVA
jgi:hypothetical protein